MFVATVVREGYIKQKKKKRAKKTPNKINAFISLAVQKNVQSIPGMGSIYHHLLRNNFKIILVFILPLIWIKKKSIGEVRNY